MKKKDKIIALIVGSVILVLSIVLICFFSIPRIEYNYNKQLDCYYVNKAYGNAKEYEILDEINGKKVLYIDEKAFMDKTNLETIKMGSNISKIERLAFTNCEKLKSIDLSKVMILERNAFMNCKSLVSVELNATDILGGVFYDCTALVSVKLNNTLTIGTYAFTGTLIEEIIIPETVYSIGIDAFYNCVYLNKIVCKSNSLSTNEYLLSLGKIVIFE